MRNVLCGLMVLGLVAMVANAQPIKDYKWDGQVTIPDNQPGNFVFAEINVPPDAGGLNTIGDLDVDMVIQHTWQGDLIVELEHVASQQRVPLIYRPGDSDGSGAGFSADNFGTPGSPDNKFIFDDEATAFYDSPAPDGIGAVLDPGIPNVGGAWIPYGSQASGLTHTLGTFDGKDKRGAWRLWVSDNAGGDQGVLLNFSLHFTNVPEPSALCLLGLGALALFRRR